jgi:cation transport regulator
LRAGDILDVTVSADSSPAGPIHAGMFAQRHMPYASNAELPASVRRVLPWDAQVIFRQSFNRAFELHHGDQVTAFRFAWTAVKRRYAKVEGHWLPQWVFEGRL